MLFSRKENIFMCLVTFQKIFWKIFSGVWRRRRKRQTQKKGGAIAPRLSRSRLTARSHRSPIVPAVDRDLADRRAATIAPLIDRRAVRSRRRSRSIAMSGGDRRARLLDDRTARRSRRWSIDERARRTIAPLVDRCSPIWALFSLSLSLSLSLFPEMIWSENEGVNSFPGQRRKFWSTRRWFPENFIFRCMPNMRIWGKMISWNHFPPKQMHP